MHGLLIIEYENLISFDCTAPSIFFRPFNRRYCAQNARGDRLRSRSLSGCNVRAIDGLSRTRVPIYMPCSMVEPKISGYSAMKCIYVEWWDLWFENVEDQNHTWVQQ
ncbi:predicted protein [Sclerotinia sclerotiorum 1980 UF-70]|uniref:Uncharacterized protein n=1 Tax=Sclerotinia sclerotiorum (strain ATCC 18683 / 1980 / Ss-1) TaxID=665079 RepID=A7F7G6_SCLS1|nr:predicted protein [Sclerotinia sclerotiorum 1980 UF-70]EDN98687.1 predicted protein [Sclerotinia sclerotiorum 1980 UF-70]